MVGDRVDAHHSVRLPECESCLGDQESGVFSLNAMPDAGPGDVRLWLLPREPPQHPVRGKRERERKGGKISAMDVLGWLGQSCCLAEVGMPRASMCHAWLSCCGVQHMGTLGIGKVCSSEVRMTFLCTQLRCRKRL